MSETKSCFCVQTNNVSALIEILQSTSQQFENMIFFVPGNVDQFHLLEQERWVLVICLLDNHKTYQSTPNFYSHFLNYLLKVLHNTSHTPMEQPSGAIWDSVYCWRTLQHLGDLVNRTTDLPINGWPALPPVSQPPCTVLPALTPQSIAHTPCLPTVITNFPYYSMAG